MPRPRQERPRLVICVTDSAYVARIAFKRSEFAIINTDNPGELDLLQPSGNAMRSTASLTGSIPDDLPIEDQMPVEDKDGLQLSLRLHYE